MDGYCTGLGCRVRGVTLDCRSYSGCMSADTPHNVGLDQRTIRFGILCNGTALQEWQARCIKNLLALDNVQLALLIIEEPEAQSKGVSLPRRRGSPSDRIAARFYMKYLSHPRAYRQTDLTNILSKVPSIKCEPASDGVLRDADIETIRGYDLDFIIHFGDRDVRGEILNVPRYGIWSFRQGIEGNRPGHPPCFWEIHRGVPITGASLERLTGQADCRIILKKGVLKTISHSYAGNVDSVHFEMAKWAGQMCSRIRTGAFESIEVPASREAISPRTPTNYQMAAFASWMLRDLIAAKLNALFRHEEWNVGVICEPVHIFLKPDVKPRIHWFPRPPRGRFRADPFAIIKGETMYVFLEDYDYRTRKGVISYVEVKDGKAVSQPRVAMDLPVHVSYPCVFEHAGEIYCVPETFKLREISLYKAERFPNQWRKIATLIRDFAGVDPTVFQHDGRWWLTCTSVDEGSNLNLYIWHAPELVGPWTPHAANPVKTDVRSSRPAGTPFMHDSILYRPAQDCSVTYGGRIVVNRVLQLTPMEFKEEPAVVIGPFKESPYPDGIHALSTCGGTVTVIDSKRHVFVWSAFKHLVTRRFARMKMLER